MSTIKYITYIFTGTIEELMDVGIGRAMGVAGICPMQFRRPAKANKKTREEEEKENKQFQKKHGISAGFYESIKSRQIVDQLVDQTKQSASFTYDYMSMLLVADTIAAMGLGTNSAVIVVASMLVSVCNYIHCVCVMGFRFNLIFM